MLAKSKLRFIVNGQLLGFVKDFEILGKNVLTIRIWRYSTASLTGLLLEHYLINSINDHQWELV